MLSDDSSPGSSNFYDHLLQARGIGIDNLAFVLAHNYSVGMAKSSPIRIVKAGFAAEGHALFQNRFVALRDPRGLVPFKSDAVPGAMFQEFLETSFPNLVQTFL